MTTADTADTTGLLMGTVQRSMANAIRALSMDAVQKANSGHPGMPMGMADVATVLFTQFLKFDPADPKWPDRDRFVLSAGHGSMLLYSVLHLTGYAGMPMQEIINFRQLGGLCAGHTEYGHVAGIETTTGPLGQGLGNAVGMAIAERLLADKFGADIVDHYTYVMAGDGCLMEGISHEAMGLAGHLKLNKLIVLFDDNSITIDGGTGLSSSEDVQARVRAYGWNAISADGHDPSSIAHALAHAKLSDKPTLIACKTTIGYGAPSKAGTSDVHGSPLGDKEIAAAREALGWKSPPFEIPESILKAWRKFGGRGATQSAAWKQRLAAMKPEARAEFERRISGKLPGDLNAAISAYKKKLAEEKPTVATRKASQNALDVINAIVPESIGGSADLTGSVNTKSAGMKAIAPDDFSGRYIYYGVREHGMAAAMNGMAVHGGVIPYSGTFLVFSDYCRPSIRLAAMMRQRVIHVMTHDSIGLGEDGPTHQPIEHLASLRAIPDLLVFRPADATETAECWQLALQSQDRPSVISLTRQNLAPARLEYVEENLCARGAYELLPATGKARVTLIATGSEVELAVAAREVLQADGIGARVVSAPCLELFDMQPADYRSKTLGADTVRIAIEAASTYGWERYAGDKGGLIGINSFGASAPYKDLYKHFGLTSQAIAQKARDLLG
ncbi:MAG: transketolase [Alphaproteobacteria bacterium]|nr:transketolase [Alphaproteobacteria bacterium]